MHQLRDRGCAILRGHFAEDRDLFLQAENRLRQFGCRQRIHEHHVRLDPHDPHQRRFQIIRCILLELADVDHLARAHVANGVNLVEVAVHAAQHAERR